MAKWPPIESAYSSRSNTQAEAELSRNSPSFARTIPVLTPKLMLDGGKPIAVTCCEDRRGSQWDFAEEG